MKRYMTAALTDAETPREAEGRLLARRAAGEGIVLLENHILPIAPCALALYGAGAAHTVKGGSGSGEVNERHTISILEGLENAGFTVTTKGWLGDYEEAFAKSHEEWRTAQSLKDRLSLHKLTAHQPPEGRLISDEDVKASGTDTAVYVVSRQAGEGADKRLENNDFTLSPSETENLRKMTAAYKNTILIINSGSYMDLSAIDGLDLGAVIFFCQQGMEGGNALADILTGAVTPSGKLSDSWAASYDDIPFGREFSYLNGDAQNEYYKEGIYVGYRYFDSFGKAPRYPFGFGLSYTDFSLTVEEAKVDFNAFSAKIKVKNTGSRPGRETVQLYVSAPQGKLAKEYQRLAAFAKTGLLAPGEEETVELYVIPERLASYDSERSMTVLEAGDYIFRLGNSSRNTKPIAVMTLDTEAIISCHEAKCVPDASLTEMPAPELPAEELPADILRLALSAEHILTVHFTYHTPVPLFDPEMKKVLESLNADELIDVCCGAGLDTLLQTDGIYAPGTVGRTTGVLTAKGLINLNMADGPAGLRLLQRSALDSKGRLKMIPGNFPLQKLETMPKILLKSRLADESKDTLYYQFATAFPVGTSLAQSWNTALCEEIGAMVSREMEEYSISYWLAPAMNIHRNPLCGRNFEYFSEDPLLTGLLAAGIVKGVQSVDGNYATVKHFACNNAEEDRNHSDSHVSERALREIYLRGFEYCIRDAMPAAVMTSYNKLNGVYTPNSRELCTDILRNEWGFRGVVITDWSSTRKGLADSAAAIKAGNNLLMSGGKYDRKMLKKALKKGTLTEDELRLAATDIISSIVHSRMAEKVKASDLI